VLNRFRDHLRGAIRRERRSVSLDGLRPDVQALRVGDDEDLRTAVRDAMQSLPPRERLVLLLNVQGGRRSREIAPLLKLGVKVTEALLTRAKRRFRDSIRQAQESSLPGRLKE
jgi:DNA-directed RNA polymerase specialized sigma24 family protein